MFNWPGLNVPLTWESERTGIENDWYALTGRVVAVKVEADDDLHIAIQDGTGDKPGLSFAKDWLDRSGVRFLPRTSSFVLRLGFAFDGSRFRGVLFRDAFSGTLFLGEEDSDPWFRDARGVARCVPHVGSLLIKRSEFFILRSSHNHINQEE